MRAIAKKINEFQNRYLQHNLKEIKYRGVEPIPVKQIKGSVNRWQDFDHRFRMKDADNYKLKSVLKAMEDGIILPPISVYKLKDDYFVIDGNHRVTAAKKFGQVDIDAEVFELIPPGDSLEHLLWRERSLFEIKTGIQLNFSELGAYNRLYIYLRLYAKQYNKKNGTNLSVKELHQQWLSEIYQPIIELIQKNHVEECFVDHTEDDLFLFILHHQITKTRLQGRNVSLEEAVADFCSKPGDLGTKLLNTFQGFVFKKKCARQCLKCCEACPEGLICLADGRLKIDDRCTGCGKCITACPKGNLQPYGESPSSFMNH